MLDGNAEQSKVVVLTIISVAEKVFECLELLGIDSLVKLARTNLLDITAQATVLVRSSC